MAHRDSGNSRDRFFLFYYPEWSVIDLVGILIGAGAAAIFGISFAVLPALVLLIALAIYDFISVYETKHMVSLAEGVVDLNLPVLFVLPVIGDCVMKVVTGSFPSERRRKTREARSVFYGAGRCSNPDRFGNICKYVLECPNVWLINVPALGAAIGTLAGYVGLMLLVLKGKPQAGLPFLNSGAIVGLLIADYIVGVKPF